MTPQKKIPEKVQWNRRRVGRPFAMLSRPFVSALAIILAVAALLALRFCIVWLSPRFLPYIYEPPLVVAEFDNDTGDSLFDRIPRVLMGHALAQSPRVVLVSDSNIRRYFIARKIPDSYRVDEGLVQKLCEDQKFSWYLTGKVWKSGQALNLKVRLVWVRVFLPKLSTKHVSDIPGIVFPKLIYVWTKTYPFSKGELLQVFDTAAADIRRVLREPDDSIVKNTMPLSNITSPDLEALQNYSLGQARTFAGKHHQAREYFRSAIKIDPEFALAYRGLAVCNYNLGERMEARTNMKAAFERSTRTDPVSRLEIEALFYYMHGQLAKAKDRFSLIVERDPTNLIACHSLSTIYTRYHEFGTEIEQEKKCLHLAPKDPRVWHGLVRAYIANSEFTEAKNQLEKAVHEGIVHPQWPVLRAILRWAEGDLAEARGLFEEFERQAGTEVLGCQQLVSLLLYQGKYRQAETHLERCATEARRHQMHEAQSWNQLALVEIYMRTGRSQLAGKLLEELENSTEDLEILVRVGIMWIRKGKVERAKSLLDRLQNKFPDKSNEEDMSILLRLEAMILASQNNLGQALASLRQSQQLLPNLRTIEAMGAVLCKQGKWDSAIEQYKQVVRGKGLILREERDPSIWVVAHHRLAELYKRKGDSKGQTQHELEYGQLWRDADKDLLRSVADGTCVW